MSTSEFGGRILVDAAALSSFRPLSSHVTRILASNVNHFADQQCFHLINWTAPLAAAGTPWIVPSTVTTFWSRIALDRVPLVLRSDGSSYPVRLALAGATSNVAGTVQFAAFLSSDPASGSDFINDTAIPVEFGAVYSTSSTTHAWLTPTRGSGFFVPPQSVVEASRIARVTLTDTGGVPAEVETVEAFLQIFATTTNAAGVPRVSGVHLSQYIA